MAALPLLTFLALVGIIGCLVSILGGVADIRDRLKYLEHVADQQKDGIK